MEPMSPLIVSVDILWSLCPLTLGMAVDLCMVYMLMLDSMTLTLMHIHSGLAKAKIQVTLMQIHSGSAKA